MKVIYKYPLQFPHTFVETDWDAKLLKVDTQAGQIMVWAIVDKSHLNKYNRKFEFQVFATGQEFETELKYLDTAQIDWTVWHVFGDMPRG